MAALFNALERFRKLPRWRRIPLGTAIFLPLVLIASFAPLSSECIEWTPPESSAFFLSDRFSAATLISWFSYLLLGWLYSSFVICAVSEVYTDVRRPVSIVIYGACMFWLGPAFTLGHGACSAEERTPAAVVAHTFLSWGIVQFAAQWFSLLDDVPALNGIVFTPAGIRAFTPLHWLLTISVTALITGLVGWQLYQLYALDRLQWYILALVLLFAFIIVSVKLAARRGYHFHFHHYSVGMLVPFFPVPGTFSSVAQAILVGITVEGLSRWGPDPFFIKDKEHSPPPTAAAAVSTHDKQAAADGAPAAVPVFTSRSGRVNAIAVAAPLSGIGAPLLMEASGGPDADTRGSAGAAGGDASAGDVSITMTAR